MKRLSLYLSLMLALFVVACGNDSKPTQATQSAQQTQLFPAGKAVATKDHGANHTPILNSSIKRQDLTLLLPRGPAALMDLGEEPATDPDGDDITYRFAFAVPGLSGIQTPAEALLRITREGNRFIFQPDGDISPTQFTSVYGEIAYVPTFPSAIYASDGTDESDPEVFNLHLVYDGSAQFSAPAEYIEDQRWEISTPIEMYEGATMPESEDLPAWTAVTAQPRKWGFAWPPLSIRCEIVTIFDPYTLPDGGDDNALFSLNSEERATAGTVSLAFKTAPDYETPGDSNADNEYQVRVVNTHDIHLLNNEGTPTGCSGSVLDVTIRVKDVGAPMPPGDVEAGFQDTDDTKIDVNWTASEGFSENGSLVEFPAGFEVTDHDYRYRPAGAAAWTEVTDADLTETTVTLEDLTEDAYEIQVRANNSEGSGAWSSTIQAEQVKRTLCFVASHYATIEGDPDGVEIEVYLDPAAGALPIAIPISVVEEDGVGPEDYSGVPSSITFAPGESMQTFTLMATEDSDHDEGAEEIIWINFGDLPKNVTPETPATAKVTLEEPIPVIEGLRIISTPESGTTYGSGEFIKVEVTFNVPVVVTCDPYIWVEFDGNAAGRAIYKNGSGTERLVFRYCVGRRDRDRNGISILSNRLKLFGGSITAVSSGVDANIDHAALPDDPNHKINGCLRDE